MIEFYLFIFGALVLSVLFVLLVDYLSGKPADWFGF